MASTPTAPDAPFLAPPTASDENAPVRTCDSGAAAMDRLRDPFAVAPETSPERERVSRP
jgi:hypothetical protein